MRTVRVSFDVEVPDKATNEQVLEGIKWHLGEIDRVANDNPLSWNDYLLTAVKGSTGVTFLSGEQTTKGE